MKYVFVNRFFYPDHSATSQMLSDLAFGLAKAGFDISVICSRQRYDDPNAKLPKNEVIDGVRVLRVSTPSFGRGNTLGRLLDYLGFYFTATWRLFKVTDKETVVIAKTDPPLISIPSAVVCKLRSATLVNWLQDLFPEVAIALKVRGTQGLIGTLLRRWRNWSLHAAAMNVAIGERMRQKLQDQHVVADEIRVIHNWADGKAIVPVRHAENPLREAWKLHHKYVVGYSGNFGRAHEFETILGAAKILQSTPDIVFLFIGAGAQLEKVRLTCESSGLTNTIFKNYQPRQYLHMSLGAADAHLVVLKPELEGLIVPSKYYGIAAAGRAVLFVGDRHGEVARLLKEAGNGSQVNPGDATALAKAIRDLRDAANPAPVGREHFESGFTFEVALQQWTDMLRGLSKTARQQH